jgi:hypothetical protein
METDKKRLASPTYQELLEQNQILQHELENMATRDRYIWDIMVETSRKLQVSSASIKAAVSSLLNYDIFWDVVNQHEFHVTINNSIDQMSELVKLVALQSRLEAGALEIKLEAYFLPEILSAVLTNASTRYPKVDIKVIIPDEGNLVDVDYVYLSLALDYLLSVFASKPMVEGLRIEAKEEMDAWFVSMAGIDQSILNIVRMTTSCVAEPVDLDLLSPESILKLRVACGIMNLQKIVFEFPEAFFKITLPIRKASNQLSVAHAVEQ